MEPPGVLPQAAWRLDPSPEIAPDEVVLKGFPWNQTICIRGRDHLDVTAIPVGVARLFALSPAGVTLPSDEPGPRAIL